MSILRSIADLTPARKAAIYAKGTFRCLPPTIQACIAICCSMLGAWCARGVSGWGGIDLPASELALICAGGCMVPAMMRIACIAHAPAPPRQITPAMERFSITAAILGALCLLLSLANCPPLQAAQEALGSLAHEREVIERGLTMGALLPSSPIGFEGPPPIDPDNHLAYTRQAVAAIDQRADDARRWIHNPTRSASTFASFARQCFAMAVIQGVALSGLLALLGKAWKRRGLAWRALSEGSAGVAIAIREAVLVWGWRALRAPAGAASWSQRCLGNLRRKAPKARQHGAIAAKRFAASALAKAPGLPKQGAKLLNRALRRGKARASLACGRALNASRRATALAHEIIVARGLGCAEEVSKLERSELGDSVADPLAASEDIKAKGPRL